MENNVISFNDFSLKYNATVIGFDINEHNQLILQVTTPTSLVSQSAIYSYNGLYFIKYTNSPTEYYARLIEADIPESIYFKDGQKLNPLSLIGVTLTKIVD